MKNFIMLIVTVFIVQACKVETPLNNSNVLSQYDKYNMANDTNWVEITDTTRIDLSCITYYSTNSLDTLVIRSQKEYKELFDLALKKRLFYDSLYKGNCLEYKPLNVDFDKYVTMGTRCIGAGQESYRNIFYFNIKSNTILQLVVRVDRGIAQNLNLKIYDQYFSINKRSNDTKYLLDTLTVLEY